MNTLFIGRTLLQLEDTASTNAVAAALAASGTPDGTVVVTKSQTAGKGMGSNKWFSDPGMNLTFSIVLYPKHLAAGNVFLLNKLVSCAILDFLRVSAPGSDFMIKWPNDLLAGKKKICGILMENHINEKSMVSSVIGIGINVNQTEFPAEIHTSATSLKSLSGKTFDLERLLADFLGIFEKWYLKLRSGQNEIIEQTYLHNLYGYQEENNFETGSGKFPANFAGVDKAGRLALEIEGKLKYFQPKEIRQCI